MAKSRTGNWMDQPRLQMMAGLGDLVLLMESTCLIEQTARENLVHETLLLPILTWMNLVGVMLETGLAPIFCTAILDLLILP